MPFIDPDTKKEKAPYCNVAQPSSESGFRKGILIHQRDWALLWVFVDEAPL